MLFSVRDIDILRLLCWCHYIHPQDLQRMATQNDLQSLLDFGLIKIHRTSGTLALTTKGISLLQYLFPDTLPEVSQSYHKKAIVRRQRVSKIALTAYRAGINIFTTDAKDLEPSPTFFLSAMARGRGRNPWGSTRVAALAHLGDTIYALHYVCPGIGNISIVDELSALNCQTTQFRNIQRSLIFAGETYQDVLTELENSQSVADAKLQSYGNAYQSTVLPIHLLSCDDTGALQLQLMALPNSRKQLARAALKKSYVPPPTDTPVWDVMFRECPFMIAVDMDLRRVDRAIAIANERRYPKISIAALEKQVAEVLAPRYLKTENVQLYTITDDAPKTLLANSSPFYQAPTTQYIDAEGRIVPIPALKK